MKSWVLAVGAGLVVLVAAAALVDGDPMGIVSGRFAAKTAALESYERLPLTPEQRGAVYFAFGDWGALSTEALEVSASPWKLATAILAFRASGGDMAQVTQEKVTEIFRRYGFVTPEHIANWPDGLSAPTFTAPLGQNVALGGRWAPPIALTVGNISCAGCHASVVYGADGKPDTSTVWLGTPNGSVNLQRYVSELYAALRDRPSDDVTWAAVQKLYPDTSWREWLMLKTVVLPKVAEVINRQEATIHRLLPFDVSTAGATNGLQALQTRLGVIPADRVVDRSVPISVPELGGRIWRSSLLAGGSYTVPGQEPQRVIHATDITPEHLRALAGVTAFFTVPSMGTTPTTAAAHVDNADSIMQWLVAYKPQPFPGKIDMALAAQGETIYAAQCASCHGSYEGHTSPRLVAFPNWQGDVGTDRSYLEVFDAKTVEAVNKLGYGPLLDGRVAPNYVAQPLTGLWSSAPYLHNGSVPTLWHLMHRPERPRAFDVGGHALDLARVGIAGEDDGAGNWVTPKSYQPWTEPVRVDTTVAGLGNAGHDAPFDTMSEADKSALLEYLKLL
jgi:mono/diheme cytochrome c family protein